MSFTENFSFLRRGNLPPLWRDLPSDHIKILNILLWLRRVSNPRPLAHQSSVLPLSQKSELRLGGDTTLLPLFLRAWYSHRQDITGYFPTNPQVGQANPIGHWIHNVVPPSAAMLRRAYESTLLTPNVVTPPSLEPTTSRTPVQRSTTKPKVRTQARGRHYNISILFMIESINSLCWFCRHICYLYLI